MKNCKLMLMTVAIAAAVCSAFATKSNSDCLSEIQYFRINTPWGYYYCYAGEEGLDYLCDYAPATSCTWVQPAFGGCRFTPCQEGRFTPIYSGW